MIEDYSAHGVILRAARGATGEARRSSRSNYFVPPLEEASSPLVNLGISRSSGCFWLLLRKQQTLRPQQCRLLAGPCFPQSFWIWMGVYDRAQYRFELKRRQRDARNAQCELGHFLGSCGVFHQHLKLLQQQLVRRLVIAQSFRYGLQFMRHAFVHFVTLVVLSAGAFPRSCLSRKRSTCSATSLARSSTAKWPASINRSSASGKSLR
jgi:hypothetical protein